MAARALEQAIKAIAIQQRVFTGVFLQEAQTSNEPAAGIEDNEKR
jgi:stage V sporulation protein SpoVS